MPSYEESAAFDEFTLQCPGYIVKAALCRIRGSQVELLETYGANACKESWLANSVSFTQAFSSLDQTWSASQPWLDGEAYRVMAAEPVGRVGYSVTLWSFEEPLQVVSVCRTANGYIIFGFANGLQSRAPDFTKKAVQRLATKLGSKAGNTGVPLLGQDGKRLGMPRYQMQFA